MTIGPSPIVSVTNVTCTTQIILDRGPNGGTPKTEIWKDDVLKNDQSGTLLDCDNFLDFWVEWTGGLIRLGLGPRSEDIPVGNFFK